MIGINHKEDCKQARNNKTVITSNDKLVMVWFCPAILANFLLVSYILQLKLIR